MELTDLDLDLGSLGGVPSRRGRKKSPLSVEVIGEITEAEALDLLSLPSVDSAVNHIQRLKTSHHNLARLISEGRSDVEASSITGYTPVRIRQLKEDPAFQELLNYYSSQVEEVYVNVHQRLATFGQDILEELQTRLENDPNGFTVRELKELMAESLDRGGYGKTSTQVHTLDSNVTDLLAAVKEEVRSRQNGRVTPLDAKARAPEDQGPAAGGGLVIEAEVHSPSPKVERIEGQGPRLSAANWNPPQKDGGDNPE